MYRLFSHPLSSLSVLMLKSAEGRRKGNEAVAACEERNNGSIIPRGYHHEP